METKLTLPILCERVGCEKYPQRWNDFFDEVMADFDQKGCLYTREDYYDGLHEKYGILSQYLDLYKEAAREVAKDENLSRFLAVLCRALQEREYHKSDLKEFSAPQKPGVFAYDMLTALAIASEAELCYQLLTERKLPREYVDQLMNLPEKGIDYYKARNNGRPGYSLLGWYQLAIDGKLYGIKRLEFEIHAAFSGKVCVFENEAGEKIALAHDLAVHREGVALGSLYYEDEEGSRTANITETDTYWEGNPVNERGLAENRVLRLEKTRWKKILSKGDPVVSVHIPAGGGLKPELVEESLAEAKSFLRTYYPDYDYKAFVCYSWLMDPQLVELLGEDSNISKFCRRFTKLTAKSHGEGVFNFIFFKADMNFDISELPENTRLEKAIKQHYLNGKAIYEITGYFFP